MSVPTPQEETIHPLIDHEPESEFIPFYAGVGKFRDQVVLISGGHKGIGRAVSLAFANEGALIAVIYEGDEEEAQKTKLMIENFDAHCLLLPGDIGDKNFCTIAAEKTIETFGRIDILVNNYADDSFLENIAEINEEQIERTFRSHLFSYFFMVQAVLPFMQEKTGSILNTTSDYLATNGAVVAFTRSLSESLREKGIRVNAIDPGRGEPNQMAGAFTWLASKEASCITGQLIEGRSYES